MLIVRFHGTFGSDVQLYMLGWAENAKKLNINLTQMGSIGTHKNKSHLKNEKSQNWIFALESAFEKRQPPLKAKIEFEQNHG